jgi:hypothetical protein
MTSEKPADTIPIVVSGVREVAYWSSPHSQVDRLAPGSVQGHDGVDADLDTVVEVGQDKNNQDAGSDLIIKLSPPPSCIQGLRLPSIDLLTSRMIND